VVRFEAREEQQRLSVLEESGGAEVIINGLTGYISDCWDGITWGPGHSILALIRVRVGYIRFSGKHAGS
jgi:hypothetical protein